jgi:ribosomal protein S18 acetylase RimI-like enzyme
MSGLQNIRVLQSEIRTPSVLISVRRMDETDCAATVQLIQQAMNLKEGAYAETSFRHHFECQRQALDDGRQLYIGVLEESIRAVVGLHHYNWGPRENVWLSWFAVDPPFQRQGIGTHLLTSTMRLARESGHTRMLIETYDNMEFQTAIQFYQNRGFCEVGRIENYLPDGSAMLVFAQELTDGENNAAERNLGDSARGIGTTDRPPAGETALEAGATPPPPSAQPG